MNEDAIIRLCESCSKPHEDTCGQSWCEIPDALAALRNHRDPPADVIARLTAICEDCRYWTCGKDADGCLEDALSSAADAAVDAAKDDAL